jgi:epsin
MIYKRFTEKSAEEWRQIYKALQLLEFLIKNGSERVIDDARSHLSLLKMLRQFHYIDLNGKDQGINVRNRAKELGELLSDVEKIRTERKKARANRNKYGGYEGGGGGGSLGLGGSSSGRMGGFGSETGGPTNFGGYSGGVYGDGGGFGGQTGDYNDTQSRRDNFEEYDEYDEGAVAAAGRRQGDVPSSPARARRETKKTPAKPKEPEEDLFDFGDEPTAATASTSNGKAPAKNALEDFSAADDDDFDDFQAAPPATTAAPPKAAVPSSPFAIAPPASTSYTTSATQFAQPKPTSGTQGQNINDLFASVSPPPPRSTTSSAFTPLSPPTTAQPTTFQTKPLQATGYQATGPNYYQSVPAPAQPQTASGASTPLSMASLGKPTSAVPAKKATGGDAFASLLGGAGAKKNASAKGASMADMARQKTSAGLWGVGASSGASTPQQSAPAGQQKLGGGLDDLLG